MDAILAEQNIDGARVSTQQFEVGRANARGILRKQWVPVDELQHGLELDRARGYAADPT